MRIGAGKKAVFAEQYGDGFRILLAQEKLPARESITVKSFQGSSLEEILSEQGIIKENVYYLLPPRQYYKTVHTFPFSGRQKIEGVIKYEVRDVLPSMESDCLTDFYSTDNEALAFSVEREVIQNLLDALGPYRENLKAVIPMDMALYYSMTALVDDATYLLLYIEDDAVHLQWVKDLKIKSGIFIEIAKDPDGSVSKSAVRNSLLSELLILCKVSNCSFVYLNSRGTAGGELGAVVEELLEELEISFRSVPLHNFEKYFTGRNIYNYAAMGLFGALYGINQPPLKRVNLLKEEFKPRPQGYVSVKEFTIVGVLLLILFFLSTAGLIVDIGFRKNQVSALKEGIVALSESAFGKKVVDEGEVRGLVRDIKEKIDLIEESTDSGYSSLRLLKELSLYFPGDVVIEYTEIIIDKDHIKFSGKARTFSDIDKIKQDLQMSDYFKEVKVTNTGTTGSTGGFTVTFVFDIEVEKE